MCHFSVDLFSQIFRQLKTSSIKTEKCGGDECTNRGIYTCIYIPVLKFTGWLYSVHVQLAPCSALIHVRCAIHGCTWCAIDFSWGFWYGTMPCPITFEDAKLLTASTSAIEWYKSRAHTSFLSEVIQILICTNSTWTRYRHVNTIPHAGCWRVVGRFVVWALDIPSHCPHLLPPLPPVCLCSQLGRVRYPSPLWTDPRCSHARSQLGRNSK